MPDQSDKTSTVRELNVDSYLPTPHFAPELRYLKGGYFRFLVVSRLASGTSIPQLDGGAATMYRLICVRVSSLDSRSLDGNRFSFLLHRLFRWQILRAARRCVTISTKHTYWERVIPIPGPFLHGFPTRRKR